MAAYCDDELTYVCEECYQLEYEDCEDIEIDLGLNAVTTYCVKFYDKFGNTYEKNITTDIGGAFTITTTGLPENFFNKHSGAIELQIFTDCDNFYSRVSFTVAYVEYNCVLLTNSEA